MKEEWKEMVKQTRPHTLEGRQTTQNATGVKGYPTSAGNARPEQA